MDAIRLTVRVDFGSDRALGPGKIRLLEAIGEILTLEVHANRGLSVRREVILGWFGRLVPRALAPSEAPCGQRGLVSFAGEGRVLVAGT